MLLPCDSPLWVSGELVTQNRYTVDGSADLEVFLQLLRCRSVIDLQITGKDLKYDADSPQTVYLHFRHILIEHLPPPARCHHLPLRLEPYPSPPLLIPMRHFPLRLMSSPSWFPQYCRAWPAFHEVHVLDARARQGAQPGRWLISRDTPDTVHHPVYSPLPDPFRPPHCQSRPAARANLVRPSPVQALLVVRLSLLFRTY